MLEIRNLGVRYGRHIALDGVSAKVEKGEICVILGANGAGKSSLLKAVAGMVTALPGTEVVMNGKAITGMKPHKIVEEGIALVPEGRGIFGDLTVAENLQLGAFAQRARRDETETLAQIYALFPRLAERKKQIARTMSGGEQQMVAIGRALMSKPDILMLDEPSLGLSPLLSKELFKSLADVAKTGVGILLVEQNAKLSLKIAQRGYLIENGLITGEDTATALMHDPAVVNAYLGGGKDASKTTKRPGSRLAPQFALPVAIEAISAMVERVADHAGRIQSAFIKAMRRQRPLPSAFDGKYDPMSDTDPVLGPDAQAPRQNAAAVAQDAHLLAQQADDLARRAERRLTDHITALRAQRTGVALAAPGTADATTPDAAPPAMPKVGDWPLRPSATDVAIDAEDLARRADQRLRAYLAERRQATARPAAASPAAAEPAPKAEIAPQARSSGPLSGIEDMVKRAEERLRAHRGGSRLMAAEPNRPSPSGNSPRRSSDNGALDIDALVGSADRRLRESVAAKRGAAARAPEERREEAVPLPSRAPDGDIEALARSAGERLRRHMEGNRAATLTARVRLYQPAVQPENEPVADEPAQLAQQPASLVGHNSRGLELDEPRPQPVAGLDAGGLAARAAAIQAAHIAERRKQKLDVFTLSPHRWS